MRRYEPPVADLLSAMRTSGATVDDEVALVITELARFARDVLAPTDVVGDRMGVTFDAEDATVTLPKAVSVAYRAYVAAGWPAASVDERHGGGGLSYVARLAIEEILCSSNLALSLNPMLTHGAIELLGVWGTDEQKAYYLPRLVSGEWTGTMNLTEPDAGSDVGALTSRAVPAGDGTYRISGTKIFITWGEHDVADNIVHMVLARTPGAPPGTKGISLFVVPKVLRDGTRNAVWCRGVEHKLGIHASPTCVLEFDGAVGELVGAECEGMAAMFTMMNAARLAIAVQGVAMGQRSFEQALDYACMRRQGVAAMSNNVPSTIIDHPDVRRMILDLRSTTRAMRLLVLWTGAHGDVDAKQAVALLTPVAKAWCTDQGVRLSSVALQVFGGAGYIEETGIAQRLRDSRIGPIYEGTNGIQAIDLVSRKVRRDGGAGIAALLGVIDEWAGHEADGELERWSRFTAAAVDACRLASDWMCDESTTTTDALAGACAYLEMLGTTIGGALLGRHAQLARRRGDVVRGPIVDADFFATEHLARVPALVATVTAGASRLDLDSMAGDPSSALATTVRT